MSVLPADIQDRGGAGDLLQQVGCVTVTTPGYPLMDDPPMMRDIKSALADTGVRVLDIELIKVTPEIEVTGLVAVDPQRRRPRTAVEVWCAKEGRIAPGSLRRDREARRFANRIVTASRAANLVVMSRRARARAQVPSNGDRRRVLALGAGCDNLHRTVRPLPLQLKGCKSASKPPHPSDDSVG